MAATDTTLTARVAAIQVKMLHIQFRAKKISEDQQRLHNQTYADNRDKIRGMRNAAYSAIDMMIAMEHIVGVINDIFATPELRCHFDRTTYEILNKSKKAAKRWKPVRNRVGGHLGIESVEQFCSHHNYKGVFISDDLETDSAVLDVLMIESALNDARRSCDIFGRNLQLMSEMKVFIEKLNEDWNTALEYFAPMMELMYTVGKAEKMRATHPSDWQGIVTGK